MLRDVGSAVVLLISAAALHAQSGTPNACSLLSREMIAKTTGLQVEKANAGPPISNSLSDCTWTTTDGTRIIVTLSDAEHMQVTMQSQLQSGATQLNGIGQSAVGTAGNAETDGGYNISILDTKGGVAISILGKAGTSERTAALARVLEAHR